MAGGVVQNFNDDQFSRSFLTARYNQDGTLDSTFGNNGRAVNSKGLEVKALAIQPDGKIVATGSTSQVPELTIVRYTANGSLDESFGMGGKVTTKFPINNGEGIKALLLQDGKIVIAANNIDFFGGNYNYAIDCYKPDGMLDSTFGTNGLQITDLGGSDDVTDAALQEDGKIVVTGYSYQSLEDDYVISTVRYNGFGDGGQHSIIARLKRFLHNHGITWNGNGNNVS